MSSSNQVINNVAPELIFAPPFKETMVGIDVPGESLSEIALTRTQQALRKTIEYSGFLGDVIETYDNWVRNVLPRQLASRTFRLGDTYVRVTSVSLTNPSITEGNQSVPLYPTTARLRGMTYSANIYVNLAQVRIVDPLTRQEEVLATASNIYIGRVPVMLGSTLCNLYPLSTEERYRVGICDSDPLGYFIIKGTERLVLIQEKMRLNRIFVILDKNDRQMCRVTCPTVRGTSIVTLYTGNEGIRLNLGSMNWDNGNNPGTIPVFSAFYVIGDMFPDSGLNNPQVIANMVLRYVKAEWRQKVWAYLQKSFVIANAVPDAIVRLAELSGTIPQGPQGPDKRPTYSDQQRIDTRDRMINHLFPNISSTSIIAKLEMLSLMIARFSVHLLGFRPLDNRDSWSNKRLVTAGQSMEQLFNSLWDRYVGRANAEIRNMTTSPTLNALVNNLPKGILEDEFVNAFSPNQWGVKGSRFQKENITDGVKRDSVLVTVAQLTKINTPTSRRVRSAKIRMVQLSQLGFVCPVETPEGETCGLVKSKAVTCYISIDRDEEIVINQIREYLSQIYDPSRPYVCIVNGRWFGWCDGPKVREIILAFRRSREGFRDISAVVDDNVLYINSEGGRPTRPLLIVDKDAIPIITKKGLWGADFPTLLSEGAVEYIDAYEQETIMLAQSVDQLQQWRDDLTRANEILRDQEEVLALFDRSYQEGMINPDLLPSHVDIVEDSIEPNYEGSGTPIDQLSQEQLVSLYEELHIKAKLDIEATRRSITRLIRAGSYTHCEIDPNAIIGISASIIPFPDRNQAPRNTYQCGMGKQSMGIAHSIPALQWETTSKALAYPNRPIAETQMNQLLGMTNKPAGMNVIVAIMCFTGFNEEDAIIFNRSSIDRGLFHMVISHTYKGVENNNSYSSEVIMKPPLLPGDRHDKYKHLDNNGIAMIGSMIEPGDVIIGRMRKHKNTGEVEYPNVVAGIGERGIVESILDTKNHKDQRVVKVKIRELRIPNLGDKFSSRHAQKGTMGMAFRMEDMPFTVDGITPDVIINPNCIPSRMTIGKLVEIVTSKVGAITGQRVNATAFNREFNITEFMMALHQHGYQRAGREAMRLGDSGQMLNSTVFIGPCFYQALRHLVLDKAQARSEGSVVRTTRQPVAGRHRNGGIRFGEMEKNATIEYGAGYITRDRLCKASDAYMDIICRTCGAPARTDVITKTISCGRCKDKAQFGRCELPYGLIHTANILAGAGLEVRVRVRPRTENEELAEE
uniref:DNA-directed RNA polymerase n=1 Tax=viral metagenome TaxID=1070528 RepID=A0A6C0BM45_9ZZZZ